MEQRSAIVVGVGHAAGVGAALARRIAAEGLHVTVLGRNEEKLESTTGG
jgi:NADP-dependent 3-hydroxy acid dehydrogenase YdfG